MKPLYLVRNPNDRGACSSRYGFAFRGPPTLMLLRRGVHEWHDVDELLNASEYHAIFTGLRLRPGRGPVPFAATAVATPFELNPNRRPSLSDLYLVRFPDDGGLWASRYGIAFGRAPQLRQRRNHIGEWDYCGKLFAAPDFHRIFKGLRLRPGEGPFLFTATASSPDSQTDK